MKNIFSNFLKVLFSCIIAHSLFSFFFTGFFNSAQDYSAEDKIFNVEDGPKAKTTYSGWKSQWYDYDNNYYTGTTKVRDNDVFNSMLYKKIIPANSWGDFYRGMYRYDKSKLDLVYPMLDRIWNNNTFNRREFVDVVVSFVQNMEYNVVTMDDCQTSYQKNNAIRQLMNSGIKCDGEVYAGVYSPLEFMANFKGDCDSRTVFLYTALKRYNYDVVILNSELYAHSILGVNIASSGKYKYYNGKRYYTWETTNRGWRLGMLPPDYSNINNWDVVL
jgi:hypothetical protein